MNIEEAIEILETEEVQKVNSFKEASELCDKHYAEWKNKATGKVECSFSECEVDNGTLYLFYPPNGVVTMDYLNVLVKSK